MCRDDEEESEGGEEESEEDEEATEGAHDRGKQSSRDRFFQMGDMDRFAEEAEQAAMRSDTDKDEDETGDQLLLHSSGSCRNSFPHAFSALLYRNVQICQHQVLAGMVAC